MKILTGVMGRGHVERYRNEIEVAVHEAQLEGLEFTFDIGAPDEKWGAEIETCEALLILANRALPGQEIARARCLSFVQKIGTAEGIDMEACRSRGIVVAVVEDMNHIAVAEHTLMFMLCTSRRAASGHADVIRADNPANLVPIATTQSQRHSNWLDHPRDSFNLLADQTLGLIGFGDIAQHVARRARGFGMKMIYTKRTRLPQEMESQFNVTFCDMPTLLRSADYVSLHATLPEASNRPIIGAGELAQMKPTGILINTARGNQIDQSALIESLRLNRIGGACLDVFKTEPVPRGEFDGLSNVMLTPHTGGVTPWRLRFRDAINNLEAFLHHRPITGLI